MISKKSIQLSTKLCRHFKPSQNEKNEIRNPDLWLYKKIRAKEVHQKTSALKVYVEKKISSSVSKIV